MLVVFVPFLREGLFSMGMPSLLQWGIVGILSLLPFFIIESKKVIFRKK